LQYEAIYLSVINKRGMHWIRGKYDYTIN